MSAADALHPDSVRFSNFGSILNAFLCTKTEGEEYLFVARSLDEADAKRRKAFDSINAEPLLCGRYLLEISSSTIVDRRTKAKLRFAYADVSSLAGRKPGVVAIDEKVGNYGRKLVKIMWLS